MYRTIILLFFITIFHFSTPAHATDAMAAQTEPARALDPLQAMEAALAPDKKAQAPVKKAKSTAKSKSRKNLAAKSKKPEAQKTASAAPKPVAYKGRQVMNKAPNPDLYGNP